MPVKTKTQPKPISKKEAIRKKLITKLSELSVKARGDFKAAIEGDGSVTDVGDDGDMASSLHESSLRASQISFRRRSILQINEALRRLDDGSYGFCDECEEEIPEGRLLANPLATHCVDCQGMREKEALLLRRG